MLVDSLIKNIASYDSSRHIHNYDYKSDCKPHKDTGGKGQEIGSVITLNSGPSASRPSNDGPMYKSPAEKNQSAAPSRQRF